MKTIEVIIGKDGSATVKTEGFQGSECLKATEALERALGAKSGEELTPEFHQLSQGADAKIGQGW